MTTKRMHVTKYMKLIGTLYFSLWLLNGLLLNSPVFAKDNSKTQLEKTENETTKQLTADQRQRKELLAAINKDDVELVKKILSRGYQIIDRNLERDHPLALAAWSGRIEIVKLLLSAGANVNLVQIDESKHHKTKKGLIVRLARLLYYRTRVDGVWKAIRKIRERELNMFNIIKLLLDAGADPNIKSIVFDDPRLDATAMSWAAEAGDIELMELLYQYGADINQPDTNNFTPITLAMRTKEYPMIEWLLQHDVDLYVGNKIGIMPIESNDIRIVKLYLNYKVIDPKKTSYLILGIVDNDIPFIERLLKAGVDVNASFDTRKKQWNMGSPINAALYEEDPKILELLLKHDADPCLVLFEGRTAYEQARYVIALRAKDEIKLKNRQQLLKILQKYKPESQCKDTKE